MQNLFNSSPETLDTYTITWFDISIKLTYIGSKTVKIEFDGLNLEFVYNDLNINIDAKTIVKYLDILNTFTSSVDVSDYNLSIKSNRATTNVDTQVHASTNISTPKNSVIINTSDVLRVENTSPIMKFITKIIGDDPNVNKINIDKDARSMSRITGISDSIVSGGGETFHEEIGPLDVDPIL